MKRLIEALAIVLALALCMAAQSQYPAPNRDDDRGYAGQWQGRLSPDDQSRFNEEYGKWQKANAKNDRDEIDKHARKMEEIMARYNIPPDTPFDTVATGTEYDGGHADRHDVREFQGRFSPDDQKKFDKAYEHWLDARRTRDRDDIAKNEGKMQEIMGRYRIPRDVPYDALASGGRGY